ncbi:hypothetical protein Pcinc_030267 [Petrolisthes cinctipes]|uniref:Solute carrier family 10 member 6 n=1 Tax=Petrolisthes cinctipes TaxID=88211 RepID=A0AAE1K2U1_PETCI|nr:hypothetical protein Pcinc_030267 [Petrolisthes cinctipes]
MCPLYPVHLVLTYGAVVVCVWAAGLGTLVGAVSKAATFKIHYLVNGTPVDALEVHEGRQQRVTFYIDDLPPQAAEVYIRDENPDHLDHIGIDPDKVSVSQISEESDGNYTGLGGSFNLTGRFLGFTRVRLVLSDGKNDSELMVSDPVNVKVQRGHRVLNTIFIHVVIAMVMVAYINMGCAIDLKVIKETLRRPVAPAIGLFCQYLFMPLVSYGLGYGLFYDTPEMWLGLFMTGCSPGGGGSNMWTYLLGGSLDLSVTMTFVSTLGAFVALPLWVFALARTIFQNGHYTRLPYRNIAMLVIGLVVPLGIGLLIKWKSPRVAAVLKRLLKPISIIFIVFIMTFGVYANLYIFSFFDWRVAVGGLLLPWLGFLFGFVAAVATRRPFKEIIAISIETGVQNTGLAIGVLKLALRELAPLGDITMVVPIAVATMTPIPLTIAYIARRVQQCRKGKSASIPDEDEEEDKLSVQLSTTNSASPLHKTATNGHTKTIMA